MTAYEIKPDFLIEDEQSLRDLFPPVSGLAEKKWDCPDFCALAW
nr:hypothetical protein [Marinicella sp. W31]MDC2879665.1 hypothetical protein [Marinicella sp. W31]